MSEARGVRDPIGRMSFGLVVVMVALLTPLMPGPAVAAASTDDPIFDFQNSLGCKAVSVYAGPFAPQITANHRFRPCQDDTEALLVGGAYVTRVPPDGQTSLTDDSTDVTVTVRDAFAKTALEPFVEATAEAHVGEFTLHHPGVGVLRVKAAESRASVTCTGASAAVMAGSSKVLSVQLNGFELLPTATSEPRVIDALSLKVALNQKVSRSIDFTQTAVIVNVNTAGFGPSSEVRLGESKVGYEPGGCDPSLPRISVGDVSVTEGDAGSANATFTVTLASPPPWDVTVNYATADATATAGSDYTATSGTLRFVPGGVLTRTVVVAVAGDNAVERDETFHLNLSNPTGSAYTDARAVATIVSDDIPAGLFRPLSSARIFPPATLGKGQSVDVQVTGVGGVPATGVSGAALSITVTNADSASFLTVWPTGADPTATAASRPTVSSLNWTAGETVANAVQAKVGAGGKVSVYNAHGTATVAVDVVGWYADETTTTGGGLYTPVVPDRILDSRGKDINGDGIPDETLGAPTMAPLAASTDCASPLELQVAGRGGVPAAGVSAVVVNLTVTPKVPGPTESLPAGSGALVAWPAGEAVPTGSNVPYDLARPERRTIPTLAVTKLGTGGKLNLCNRAPGATWPMHAVADVVGWYSSGSGVGSDGGRFVALEPARLLDTRAPCVSARACIPSQIVSEGATATPVGEKSTIELQVSGRGGVPALGASAVVLNVTVTNPTANSFLTLWPTSADPVARTKGSDRPTVSNLNYVPTQTVPNLVVVKVGEGGKVSLYNQWGSVDVIADVVGWFAAT